MQAYQRKALVVLCLVGAFAVTAVASAAPAINSIVFNTRVFNDDPGSTLSVSDNYGAGTAVINETNITGGNFANLHNWKLSVDNIDPAQFQNGDSFAFSFDMMVSGAGQGESGLHVSPWWSPDVDGRINVRTTDGEIAAFGGRLPFYSFTANHGISYTKGEVISLGVIYQANSLSMADPATIQYFVSLGGNDYTSGPLAFDQGNPAEDPPHGLWGMLSPTEVGAFQQTFINEGASLRTDWSNISFVPEPATLALVLLGGVAVLRRRVG